MHLTLDDAVLLGFSKYFETPPWSTVSIDELSELTSKYGRSAVKQSIKSLIRKGLIVGIADESDDGMMEVYCCSSITQKGNEHLTRIK
jgi:DNA-binding MarR family transcriptional regulator